MSSEWECTQPEEGQLVAEVTCEFGRALRGQARFELEAAALRYGVKLDIVENRGWLSSKYFLRVSGPYEAVRSYGNAINAWGRRVRGES